MATSSYDPSRFEFVARMGRIPHPDSSRRKKEKIPVMFRMPDPPKPEVLNPEVSEMKIVLHQGSSPDEPLIVEDPKPEPKLPPSASPPPHSQRSTPSQRSPRSTPSPPRHSRRKREHTKKVKEKKDTAEHVDKTLSDSKEDERQQDLQHTAQQLVKQALLEHQLKQLHRRERMLKSIRRRMKREKREGNQGVTMETDRKHPEVSEELMGYVRQELERLMPIVKESKK